MVRMVSEKHHRTAYRNLMAGSVAGAIAKTATYPLDRIKMNLQVGAMQKGNIAKVIREEGLICLWKGNAVALARTFPQAGVAFATFDLYMLVFERFVPKSTCSAFAGAAAGMTATLTTYPLDVWNTRMAVSSGRMKYMTLADNAVRSETAIVRGFVPALVRSTYRGVLPTLAGSVPYAASSFWIYTTLKTGRLRATGQRTLCPRDNLCIGGLAGAISQTLLYPVDTIRKRVQGHAALRPLERCPSCSAIAKDIWRANGIRGFYNGVSFNWIKGFLAAGMAYTLNERFRYALLRVNPRS